VNNFVSQFDYQIRVRRGLTAQEVARCPSLAAAMRFRVVLALTRIKTLQTWVLVGCLPCCPETRRAWLWHDFRWKCRL